MFNFLLVVLTICSPILIAILISKYFKHRTEVRTQFEAIKQELEKNKSDQSQAEIKGLRERIEVLERIVTDPKSNLRREIDDL